MTLLNPLTHILLAFFLATHLMTADADGAQEVTFLAGGDIQWAQAIRRPWFDQSAIQPYFNFKSAEDAIQYPFQNIAALLQQADVTFANLENPLSSPARLKSAVLAPKFVGSPAFSQGLKQVGIDVVATANNHALDAGFAGVKDTLQSLAQEDVAAIGSGDNLEKARSPFIVDRKGIRFALLGYTMLENSGLFSYAASERGGVVPAKLSLIQEDIRRARLHRVDYVILSIHWGLDVSPEPPFWVRQLAHAAVEAGADLVLGHHSHIPQGIEMYHGTPIVYSPGNLIFGYSRPKWEDNYVTRFTFTRNRIKAIEILPIAGHREDVFQPFQLTGERAHRVLTTVQRRSRALQTDMEIVGDIGRIVPGLGSDGYPVRSSRSKSFILCGWLFGLAVLWLLYKNLVKMKRWKKRF